MMRPMPSSGPMARRLARLARRAAAVAAIALVTVVGLRAREARRPPGLEPWHRFAPPSEATARELTDAFTLAQYLAREDAVFREVAERIERPLSDAARSPANRYNPSGIATPRRFARDWNRTFELVPPEIRGGALLLHGLTDSPYSMRALAELLRDRGFYALVPRLPGHGTVPGALTRANRADWLAAARLGARHVALRAGAGRPFLLVGYSNGGALAVKYALDQLDGAGGPRPDSIVLVSPMIRVSRAAAFAKYLGVLAVFPYFEKTRWLEVVPEYNPFKYNSFPVHAASQTSLLTSEIRAQIRRAAADGRLSRMPRLLTFQSVADATVSTGAVVRELYAALPANGSELVLFDLNRQAIARPFLRPADEGLLATLIAPPPRRYALTVVTNRDAGTPEVVARTYAADRAGPVERELSAAWPPQVYSLSHVALPFPSRDPLYGGAPEGEDGAIRLGVLAPRGERGVLTVSPDQFLRISWNPFFAYLAERVARWTAPA